MRRSSWCLTATSARLCSLTAFQKHCFAARSIGRGLTATKGVLACGCFSDEVSGAILSPWCILIGHSWLHDLLQSFALRSQFVHRFILHLQRVLKIIDHPLLNLLQLRDSILVGRADARMFQCLGRMRRRHICIVHLPVVVGVCFGVLAHGQAMVGAVHVDSLLIILCLEAIIRNFHRLLLEILADARVICEHSIRVTPDASPVSLSSLLVEQALLLLLVL